MTTLGSIAPQELPRDRHGQCLVLMRLLAQEIRRFDAINVPDHADLRRKFRDVFDYMNVTKTMCDDELAGYLILMATPNDDIRGDGVAIGGEYITERARIKPL